MSRNEANHFRNHQRFHEGPPTLVFQSYYGLRSWWRFSTGVSAQGNTPPVYVTLTSYPKRFGKLHLCIQALLSQSWKPDGILLWIDQNPDTLPKPLKRLRQFGLDIRIEPDIGPFGKIVYALRQFPEAILVTADDDNIYPSCWLQALMASYCQDPFAIHCHRAIGITLDEKRLIRPYDKWNYGAVGYGRGPSMYLVPTGVSGVLYPPGSLHPDSTNVELFKTLCPTNNDLWLKTMSMLKGTPCSLVGGKSRDFYIVPSTQIHALWHENESGKAKEQLEALLDYYRLRGFFSEQK